MEKLVVLGTGNAAVTKCYNTCFSLFDGEEHFLVDGGGGNGILRQLREAEISTGAIRAMFVSHAHTDHIFGAIWVIRSMTVLMRHGLYTGNFTIYCHHELAATLRTIAELTLVKKMLALLDTRIFLQPVADGETVRVRNWDVTFFDIRSTKEKQFGFSFALQNGKKLTFLGDEPCNAHSESRVAGSDWLLSEAFCLYAEREKHRPYEKHHSSVKEACELAERLAVPNLVLWHTEDDTFPHRKALYTAEGKSFYSGNLYVPDDLEILSL